MLNNIFDILCDLGRGYINANESDLEDRIEALKAALITYNL